MEAPGTAPGSETLMSRGVYRHSRFPDGTNIGALSGKLKASCGPRYFPGDFPMEGLAGHP